MILDVIVKKSDDGYTAEIPSLKGCESWAHDEDTVLEKILEIASFYLRIDSRKKLKLDKARVSRNRSVYKLVVDKEVL
jgi:predicted RNase H-like HicB family nuclease